MSNQILPFINLHFQQLKRVLISLGLFRFVFVLAVFVLACLALFAVLKTGQNLEMATGAITLLILAIQVQRTDITFLKIQFHHYRKILFIEYLILSIPLTGFLIFFLRWELIMILFAAIILIPFIEIKWSGRFRNSAFQNRLPDDAFEWKAGVRKNLWIILLIFFAGLGFSFLTGAVPLAVFALGVFPLKFYERGEPAQMLIVLERNASGLILKKFKIHLLIFSCITAPLIFAFLIFHFELWYIVLAEYVLFLSLHFYFIVIKYAFYVPNEKPAAVEVFTAIGTVGVIIPVLLPIVWVLTVWMFFRAKRNLKPYLHDFDR
jgi:hypothetical protein